ncbi:MAG: hypothetical protein JXR07_12875 [Reichenbachiella sp.]
MKLRILKNYLRLRLSQSEIKELEDSGKVISQTNFSNAVLSYELVSVPDIEDLIADLNGTSLTISMPQKWVQTWLSPEEVGKENKDQSQMRILVEKDFQCLHKRSGEDESDNFPNPLATN